MIAENAPSTVPRQETEAFHRKIVERGVLAIQTRFAEEGLSLSVIAAAAISSPFHFARLFRRISGIPPCHFLTAVRMHAAKRLLLESTSSVTNICLDVGYSSIGTFTRRFKDLVGVSPRAYRRLGRMTISNQAPLPASTESVGGPIISGSVSCPVDTAIALGLFPTPVPQGRPVACALLDHPGAYQIAGVPDGEFYLLAIALNRARLSDDEPEYRGGTMEPIFVGPGSGRIARDVRLRPRLVTDPPIVVSIPALIMCRLAAARTRGGMKQ